MTTPDELVERVARALSEDRGYDWDKHVNFRPAFRRMATAALAVALEEAAKVADACTDDPCEDSYVRGWNSGVRYTAAAIRALIKTP